MDAVFPANCRFFGRMEVGKPNLKGLLVIMGFVILISAIVVNACVLPNQITGKPEGFANPKEKKPCPLPPPTPLTMTGKPEPVGLMSVSDLPSAPIVGLAETNALPYEDPATAKSTFAMLNELKQDMDGFVAFEAPHLKDRSDPAVKLPLMKLTGDHQRLKDELSVIRQNPSVSPQLTVLDLNDMAANLRFLQRTYRLYAASGMVPAAKEDLTKVGAEGFADMAEGFTSSDEETPITTDELANLSTKLAVEITRLKASGSTDPVLAARASMFTKIRQTVDDLNTRIKNGTLAAKDIPITKAAYAKFLPALGSNSAGIAGLLAKTGNTTLSSLFNSYDAGDISGSDLAAALFETYADSLLNGLSYDINISYTSPNDVKKEQAKASQWDAKRAVGMAQGDDSGKWEKVISNHPRTLEGSRGSFEEQIRGMDIAGFQNSQQAWGSDIRPPSVAPTKIGSFDWKERSEAIYTNIQRTGSNPADFGCLPKGTRVSSDFNWRGHTKMVCSRLATHVDPGFPEQMGCPPVSWPGWKQ